MRIYEECPVCKIEKNIESKNQLFEPIILEDKKVEVYNKFVYKWNRFIFLLDHIIGARHAQSGRPEWFNKFTMRRWFRLNIYPLLRHFLLSYWRLPSDDYFFTKCNKCGTKFMLDDPRDTITRIEGV